MLELEDLKKLRDAMIFEAAWLFESTKETDEEKKDKLEYVKVVWNRAFQRAGFAGEFNDLSITEEDIRKAAELWSSRENRVFMLDELKNS